MVSSRLSWGGSPWNFSNLACILELVDQALVTEIPLHPLKVESEKDKGKRVVEVELGIEEREHK